MNEQLNNALSALEFEAKLLFDELDRKSQQILLVERTLRDLKANFPFYYHVATENGITKSLCWEEQENKTFRLAVQAKNHSTSSSRPLCELPIKEKFDYLPLLNSFIKAFAKHLCEINTNLKGLNGTTINADQ